MNIYGSKKTFENHANYEKIFLKRNKNIFKKIKSKYLPKDKGALIPYFLKNLNNRKQKRKLINDMFRTLSVCFAIEKSLKNNSSVKVNYIEV